jgi:DNA-binding NarL/FixJ family response regulator
VSALRRKVRERPLPEQYRERFAKSVADILWQFWSRDFDAACAGLSRLRSGAGRGLEEQALCSALLALAQAALSDLSAARRSSRRALAAIPDERVSTGQRADGRRYLNLARALAAAACLLIDDSVRGRRAFNTRLLRNDSSFRCLEEVADGGDWQAASERTRGFARVVATVRDVVRAKQFHALTSAERLILALIADGKSAPDIAKDLGRSLYTVRAHTRSIISKLNVSGRVAAVAEARRLGIVN